MIARFPLLLIVDDDPSLCRTLGANLRADGYEVMVAGSARQALSLLKKGLPNLAIVDLILPDMHGFELCRRIKKTVDLPVIMLTGVDVEDSRVDGLDLYAEDYVVKPFSYRELAARISRVLKRTNDLLPKDHILELSSEVTLNLSRRLAAVRGQEVRLTPVECRLLQSLARRRNRLVSTAVLIDEVWTDGEGDESRVWVNIRRMRDKLERDPNKPRHIVTERGLGYKLVIDAD